MWMFASLDVGYGTLTICLSSYHLFLVGCTSCGCCCVCPFCVLCDSRKYFATAFAVCIAHETKNLHLFLWAKLILWGMSLWHANIILSAVCLVVCKHYCGFICTNLLIFYGWWFNCCFLALNLIEVVRSTMSCFRVSLPLECGHACALSKIYTSLGWVLLHNLILNSEPFGNGTMFTVLAGLHMMNELCLFGCLCFLSYWCLENFW